MWARNPLMSVVFFLALLAGGALLLPVVGVLLMVVVAVIGLVLLLVLLAPLLVKLPWFRDRIRIHRTFDFGQRTDRPRMDDDVIDVEGREVEDRD